MIYLAAIKPPIYYGGLVITESSLLAVTTSLSNASMVITVVIGIVALVGGFYGIKYKVVADVEAKNADAEKSRGDRLELDVSRQHEIIAQLNVAIEMKDAAISKLEALPRVEHIVTLLDVATKERHQISDALLQLLKVNERMSTAIQLWATERAKREFDI